MKRIFLVLGLIFATSVLADTPPPGTVTAKIRDSSGNAIGSTGGALNVSVTSGGGGGTVTQGPAGVASWLMQVTSSALPSGAATSALQTSANASLTSIDSKLTSPLAVSGTFWQATQPVSGTLTCNAGTGTLAVSGPLTDAQLRASAVPVSVSGVATSANQATEITALGTINTTLGSPFQAGGSIGNSSFGISGTLPAFASTPTFNLGTLNGAATAANQATQITSLASIVTNTANIPANLTVTSTRLLVDGSGVTQPVSGPLTDTQLRASAVPVSGSFYQATQPVSAVSLPLPTGASLEATQLDIRALLEGYIQGPGQIVDSNVYGSVGMASVLTGLPTYTSGNNGYLSMTTNGLLRVDGSNVTQPVSGTFWQATQPVSGPLTDTQLRATAVPVSGTVAVSNSFALDASVTGLQVTQNSTTSGQSGSLVQGAVTTAAPSYTTAKTSPLSLTTAGALRTDGSATTQPVSIATAPALVASSAIIGKVGIDQTTPGTTNGVQVNAALPAGSNVIGHVIVDTAPSTAVTNAGTFATQAAQSGTWTVQPGNTANTTAWLVNSVPKTPTAATVKQAAITIGTSAVRLTTDGSAPDATRVLLVAQLLSSSTANCFLGSSSVTSSSTGRGVQMFAGQSYTFNNDAGDYYAICDATTQTFLITEQE